MKRNLGVVTGLILENIAIAGNVFEMVIEANVGGDYIPGRFLNIYIGDKSLLLPRPISISRVFDGAVAIVYRVAGKGTECLSLRPAGKPIKFSGPFGNGYRLEENYGGKKLALIGGGIGIPPLLGLAEYLKARKAAPDIFLGFQSDVFLVEKFEKNASKVSIATEGGGRGFHGNVLELLLREGIVYDEYFACGPKGMLKALSDYTKTVERSVQVSAEERMGCGYGACLGCAIDVLEDGRAVKKRVCADGPVFYGEDVVW